MSATRQSPHTSFTARFTLSLPATLGPRCTATHRHPPSPPTSGQRGRCARPKAGWRGLPSLGRSHAPTRRASRSAVWRTLPPASHSGSHAGRQVLVRCSFTPAGPNRSRSRQDVSWPHLPFSGLRDHGDRIRTVSAARLRCAGHRLYMHAAGVPLRGAALVRVFRTAPTAANRVSHMSEDDRTREYPSN